jgi:tetratricopeptide (TPR) repeat protein
VPCSSNWAGWIMHFKVLGSSVINHPMAIDNMKSSVSTVVRVIEYERKRHDTAIEYYKQALKLYLEGTKGDTYLGEEIYNNIGSIYHSKRNLRKAASFFKKALHIYECESISPNFTLAVCYHNIASTLDRIEEQKEALDYYEKTLDIFRVISKRYPSIANIYNEMGIVHKEHRMLSEAKKYFKQAVYIARTVLPSKHLILLLYELNYAVVKIQ